MADPELKVKLRADDAGVAEVIRELINELKVLKGATQQAGGAADQMSSRFRSAGKYMRSAGTDFKSATSAIADLGAVIGAARFLQFGREAIGFADSIREVGQKTGASTELLSALAVQAETAGASLQDIDTAFKKFSATLFGAQQGSKEAAKALGLLGLSARDLQGLTVDQAFARIIDGFAKLPDGARKSEAAVALFGKSGRALIPLLNDLAQNGLEPTIQKARELGLLIDGQTAKAADDFGDALTNLKQAAQGVALEFARAFLPIVVPALQGFVGLLQVIPGPIKAFAGGVLLLTSAVIGLAAAFRILQAINITLLLTNPAYQAAAAIGLLVVGIGILIGKLLNLKKLAAPEGLAPPPEDAPDIINQGGDTSKASRLADQARQQQAQAIERALALQNAAREEELRRSERWYDQGLTSLEQYYAGRFRVLREGLDRERAALAQQRTLVERAPAADAEARLRQQQQLAELAQKDALLVQKYTTDENRLLDEQADKRKALQERALQFQNKLDEARGQGYQAVLRQIEAEVAQLDTLLAQLGVGAEERTRRVDEFRQVLSGRARLDEGADEARGILQDLSRQQADVQAKVTAGVLTELQGQQQIAAIESARLPRLREIATAQLAAAQALGDPQAIATAQAFASEVERIALSANFAQQQIGRLKADLQSAVAGNFSQFLTATIFEAKNLGDALRSLATSIVQSIQQVIGQFLANLAADQLFRLLSSGGAAAQTAAAGAAITAGAATLSVAATATTGAAVALGAAASTMLTAAILMNAAKVGFLGFATGGVVPGSGLGDTVPAMLTPGEFVFRKQAVAQLGLPLLRAMNGGLELPAIRRPGGLTGYARGGLVEAAGHAGDPAAAGGGSVSLEVGLEEGLVARLLETSAGQRAVLKVATQNRKAFRAIVGS